MRKSSWLVSAQENDPSVTACGTCNGSGWANQAAGRTCGSCHGFGY
jgi:DnaJ-class molecular chaperone